MIRKTNIIFIISLCLTISYSEIPLNNSRVQLKYSITNSKSPNNNDNKENKYIYPGRAMLYSALLPGLGELYSGDWKRALFFAGIELVGWSTWYTNTAKSVDETDQYKAYADEHWDFLRWMEHYYDWQHDEQYKVLFSSITESDTIYENIWEGSHHLSYTQTLNDEVITMSTLDECLDNVDVFDGFCDYYTGSYGNYELNEQAFNQLVEDSLNFMVVKDGHYYENIFKYNHFHAGWDDAADITIYDSDGYLIAKSDNKWKYRAMRNNVANYQEIAGYAISAVMFNHVASMIDAVFTAKAKNSQFTLSARPTFNPKNNMGIGGLIVSIRW